MHLSLEVTSANTAELSQQLFRVAAAVNMSTSLSPSELHAVRWLLKQLAKTSLRGMRGSGLRVDALNVISRLQPRCNDAANSSPSQQRLDETPAERREVR